MDSHFSALLVSRRWFYFICWIRGLITFNRLNAKFFWENIKIYLYFLSFIIKTEIPKKFEIIPHMDGLVQERRNSIANTLELRLSCNNPLI